MADGPAEGSLNENRVEGGEKLEKEGVEERERELHAAWQLAEDRNKQQKLEKCNNNHEFRVC